MLIPGLSSLDILLLATGVLLFVGFAAAGILSKSEREPTAFRRFLLTAITLPAPFLLLGLVNFPDQALLGWIFIGLFWGAALALLLPIRIGPSPRDGVPAGRFDERDTIFSRADLEPGSRRFKEYYKRQPENLEADNRFRSEPGLLSPRSREADRFAFAAVEAGFMAEEHLRLIADGPVSAEQTTSSIPLNSAPREK